MSNVAYYKESFVRGFGNEFLFTSAFVLFFLFLALYIIFRCYSVRTRNTREYVIEDEDETPRVYNMDQTCAICLSEQRLSVETNCGHIFCGICLRSLYFHNNCRIITCPICRQRATIIFVYFNEDERNSLDAEVITSRDLVCNFVNHYNRKFSGRPRSVADYLFELPILLRHLWNDFFTVHGLLRNRMRIRILICIISAVIYLLIPTDAVPETVFGILGLIDDFVVVSFIILYLCLLYRNAVANGNFEIQNLHLF